MSRVGLTAVQSVVDLLLGKDAKQRPQRVALLCVALLGLGLRIFNYALHPPSLWQDEAYWASKAIKTAAIDAQIRPLGFMLVTQFLARTVKVAAWVFRILPFVGSLVSMGLAPFVVLRLFQSHWARLLALLLLALNPVALEMAVEFKHYGSEVGVYVGLLAALLYQREQRSLKSLVLLLGVAWLSFFFSITVIFFYPALFGLLAWDAWQSKRWRRLVATGAVAVVCLGTITTIYFTTWRTIKTAKAENKWGTFYDVFYVKNGLRTKYDTRPVWTAAKYFELAGTPGVGRTLWQAPSLKPAALERLQQADWALWSTLHLAGIAFLLWRRRFFELLALWTPLLFVTGFNLAGRWPAGAFRTNTFYIPFAIFLVSFATEWLGGLAPKLRFVAPAVLVLLLAPTAYFRPGLTEKGLWAKPGDFVTALSLLPKSPPKAERTLIMDFDTCRPWDYYTTLDESIGTLGSDLRRMFKKRCQRQSRKLLAEMARDATPERGFWMILTDQRKYETIARSARKTCEKVEVTYVAGKTHMVLHCNRGK